MDLFLDPFFEYHVPTSPLDFSFLHGTLQLLAVVLSVQACLWTIIQVFNRTDVFPYSLLVDANMYPNQCGYKLIVIICGFRVNIYIEISMSVEISP